MENDVQDTRALLRQVPTDHVDAIARLPRDLAIIKMDNDNMMALAAARPRNYEIIQADIEAQIKTFPEFARKARYSKPVGRLDKCPACGADNKAYKEECWKCHKPIPMKIANGLSIRAAEALRLSFGFTKLTRIITETSPDVAQLDITLCDFQSGNVTTYSTPVSKTYTKRDRNAPDGRVTVRIPDDRFYDLTIKAKASILTRDVILNMVPAGMKASLETTIIKAQSELLDEATIQKLINSFASKGVTQQMLENTIGKPLNAFTHDDRATLAGLWTSIEDGETTAEEAFGASADSEPATTGTSGLGASLKAQADKAPVTLPAETSATVTVDASDVEQKKALLSQISHACVTISGGKYGSTDPVIAKYRPVDMTATVANLQACLAELTAMLPENHKDRQPAEQEQPKRGRGRPKGSGNKPAEAPQEASALLPADPFAPGSVIEFPPPAIPPEIAAYVAKMSTEAQAEFIKRHNASGKKFEQLDAATLEAMAAEARDESNPSVAATVRQSIGALKTQFATKGGNPNAVFAKYGLVPGGSKTPADCPCWELRQIEADMSEALAALMAAAPQEQPPAGDWFGGQ